MATTEVFYNGDGSDLTFTIPFEYLEESDVKVSVGGTLKTQDTDYTFSTLTEITFTTAPPSGTNNVRIFRDTDIDSGVRNEFFAGSAIRAQDLNDDFLQVLYSAQEIEDQYVTKTDGEFDTNVDMNDNRITEMADPVNAKDAVNKQYFEANSWDDETETIHSNETWNAVDSQIATTASIENRVTAKIDDAITNDIGTDGTGITVSDDGDGTITLGLAQNTIDFDRIKNTDIITQAEQDAGTPAAADSNVFTALGAARRFDTLVQSGTPSGSDWETGKTWYQNDEDKTVYVWDGNSWEAITSGGAFTRLDQVIYVDANNGDDNNNGHRISTPKKTIKSALAAINGDSTYGDGSTILVAPGIYKEVAPLDIQKKDVSIIGASIRNVIVHPTQATETNSLFRVNSGTYLHNMTFTGVKASGTRGASGSLWEDSTYGLPPTQGWNVSFYPNAMIYKSPYIQNCTNFSDSEIDNDALDFYTGDSDRGQAGDQDHAPTGGGLLVDGSTVHDDSPLRSIVADSYTHVGLDGPGIFVTNNGYTQITSSYAFFNHFHIACLNGGQANLAASTSDFGRFSLVASGKSTTDIFDGLVKGSPSTNDTTFVVDGLSANTGWHGSAVRPASNMLVEVGGNLYPILSATRVSDTEFTVEISRPDTNDRTNNLGLSNSPADNSAVKFYLRSQIASSGHTMEYVGAGLDYRALPENATGTYTYGATTKENGVPIEAHQKIELDNGKIWAAITDHNGKFRVGETFSVDQTSGFVNIPAGALSVSTLLEDLNVNGKEIKTATTNQDIVLNPNGTGVVNVSTSRITNVVDPTNAQDAATKNFVDNLTTSTTAELNILDGATLNTSELNILDGATLDTNELNQLDGASLTDNPTWTSTTQFPSAAAINTRFLGLLNALGGFVAIADENSFPNDNPDPSDGAGTVVSIADAGGMSINASGTGTGQTLGGDTVTITGFPASFNSSTLPAQQGLQVQTTTTLNTYTYHKVIARDDDIVRLNDDVNDFFQRYRFGASNPTTDNDAGDLFFNTGSGTMLVWDTSGATNEWKEVQSIGEFFVIPASEFPTWNGTINDITITNAPANASQIILSINGVVQEPNTGTARPTDGFALDGSVIRLSDAPASGSEAWGVIIGSTVNIGAPSANTVSSDKIVDGAVIEAKLGTGSVTSGKIGADAVDGSKIADDSIDSEHYVDGSIDTAHLADDAVDGTKLANTTVTAGSYTLSSITVDAQGRITAASSGTAADPDIIIEGNTSVEVVDTGSNGEVRLTTEGTRAVTVDSSQRVGIGTTDPGSGTSGNGNQLVLRNTAAANSRSGMTIMGGNTGFSSIYLADTDSSTVGGFEYSHNLNQLQVRVSDLIAQVINSNGNVGIGTTGPSSRFHVSGGDNTITLSATGNNADATLTLAGTNNAGSSGNICRLISSPRDSGSASAATNLEIYTRNHAGTIGQVGEFDWDGNFKFNSGFGSLQTAYGVRVWVNFNGTGTVSIRNSGNASSITDHGTGVYSVNYTNAMPDTNYAVFGTASKNTSSHKRIWTLYENNTNTTSTKGSTGHSYNSSQEVEDCEVVTVCVVR